MSNKNEPALISIGSAVEILQQDFPEVSISSLRFLEREGLISPQRKPGGHRVFSNLDIDRIRRIKRWQAERIPLKEISRRLENTPMPNDLGVIVKQMTSHLFDEDIPATLRLLREVHQSGLPLLSICDDVLTPVLLNLGDDKGNHLIPVDVQMEFDQQLIAFFSVVTINPGHVAGMPIIVAACPPWERHDMPLRMLVALLTERGASVHFIGAQVDSEFVRGAIERLQPDLALVSLTVEPPDSAQEWLTEISESMNPPRLVVAGGTGSEHLSEIDSINLKVLGTRSYREALQQILVRSN